MEINSGVRQGLGVSRHPSVKIIGVNMSQSARISQRSLTISDDLTFYLTYTCTLYRLGDFFLGRILVYWHIDF